MDCENKQITGKRSRNVGLLLTGILSSAAVCVFMAWVYPLIYDMDETAARIMMILPLIFCLIISSVLYACGSSTVTREASSVVLFLGAAAALLLFKSFCGSGNAYYYTYGNLDAYIWIVALACLFIFDCVFPLVVYSALVVILCAQFFTSEYTVFVTPAALFCLIPVFIYTIIRYERKDYRSYFSIMVLAAAVLFSAAVNIEILALLTAVALVIAIVAVLHKFKRKMNRTDFSADSKKTVGAVLGIVAVSAVILTAQQYYTQNIDRVRVQNLYTDFKIEKLEITDTSVTVYLRCDKLSGDFGYTGEKYALLIPEESDEPVYHLKGYSDTKNDRKSAYILSEYLNGKSVKCSIRNQDKQIIAAKAVGVYDSDDWESACIGVSVDDEGKPGIIFLDDFEISGNETLEKLFFNEYSVY